MDVELPDHSALPLGKLDVRLDSRTLQLTSFIPPLASLPVAPDALSWFSGMDDFGAMGNMLVGDCTIAEFGHAIQTQSGALGPMYTMADQTILDAYRDWTGWIPGNPSTDRGAAMLTVLNKFRQLGLGGEELVAYAAVNFRNEELVRKCVEMFGGVCTGLLLPITAQRQPVWSYASGAGYRNQPGSWGGHAAWFPGYSPDGPECITWGQRKKATWEFWHQYVDECYVLLTKRWLEWAPRNFALGDLLAALKEITQ